ncbi:MULTISPECIES: BRCT domain-containing protein [Geobacillus]|uniref:NAD-dependent DNA ligase n=1 Tax=Geobacillus thermopakistaniensis (strain MAS1) TaxID=1408282 RepID=A0A7U9J957_GEOTM|nr:MULTISPECIES: BRCT domain-containing protein [Geobacillus]MED4973687.1 BRCT domain-containing protein [Geobacillus thermoleovorans]ESU71081.1 NAD-dependent DNA ligase [Geobacillus sp. MAS1]KMY62995.1 NAD-dependent DNA ligase [Geobacillus stearothermophilus]KMY63305.1 NAD-dependent DNA ligase [Geobacillus stearothermophilus]KMY64646.1 NAD-dependent DNA ligase [Geobacillus stearothermophilus]
MSKFKEIEDYRKFASKAELHKSINSLIGIIHGIRSDNITNEKEITELIHWCNLHRRFAKKAPFNEIIPLIDQALLDNKLEEEELEDILWLCNNIINENDFNSYYDVITSSIQQLHGILHGIMADNVLNDMEIEQLSIWIDDHDFLRGTYPFDEIHSLLVSVKQDGMISEDEKNLLKAFFTTFIDTKVSRNIHELDVKFLQSQYSISGICAVNPEIIFENKVFSFTGASHRATRNEIARIIQEMGGIFNDNVTKSTNYLIVGGNGNPCWAFACYGRKVEKAIELRKKGTPIVIVHENDFWDEVLI